MLMDVLSIGSFLAFWVVSTLAGYWGVTRVSKMRAEKRGGQVVLSNQESGFDAGADGAGVHGHRGAVQASVTPRNPVAGQSARDGYSRFQHLSPFRANPR